MHYCTLDTVLQYITVLQYYRIAILQYHSIAVLQYHNITVLQYYNIAHLQCSRKLIDSVQIARSVEYHGGHPHSNFNRH